MQEYLEIGQIVGTHGIKGIIKVKPLTDDIKRFDKLKTVYIVGAHDCARAWTHAPTNRRS